MIPSTRIGVQRHYDDQTKEVRNSFYYLPALLAEFPLDISISYQFGQIELAHNMTLYCGVVKRHKANPTLTRAVINTHHMTRQTFRDQYSTVFNTPISDQTLEPLTHAERIRDRIMHGKNAPEGDKREAICRVLTYAQRFNDEVYSVAGFRPFGSLKGFKGRAQSLDQATTRWLLKGMGFAVS